MLVSKFSKIATLIFLAMSFGFLAANSLVADINDARVTEVWVGLGGGRPDGTHDWIEVTNTGSTPIDTAGLSYDDENPSFADANELDSIILGPGESAVFLLDINGDNPLFDTSIEEFLSVWVPFDAPLVGDAGFADKLSTGGDEANLFNLETGQIVDTLAYSGSIADQFFTIERVGEAASDVRMSVLGENGAFESQMYFDEDTGNPAVDSNGNLIILVGSPGVFQMDLVGDLNCDGQIDLLDVAPFVQLVTSGTYSFKGDLNGDFIVNLLDVSPFVELLVGE